MKNLNSNEFTELTNSNKLTLVKYFGSWCGPCRMLNPVIESLIPSFPDVNFGEVDIDAERELALNSGIRAVPTIIFYKNGKVLDRLTGVNSAQYYIQKLEEYK